MSKLTLFVVSGKIDRVGRLHGRSKFSSELVWRSWFSSSSLVRAVSQEKLMQNGGTEGAPRGDGPSLKIFYSCIIGGSMYSGGTFFTFFS
jgi:hypothetical protein